MSARIIAARRTAVAPRGGAFAGVRIEDLGAPVVLSVLAYAGLSPEDVDEVICANALGAGGNPARRVSVLTPATKDEVEQPATIPAES